MCQIRYPEKLYISSKYFVKRTLSMKCNISMFQPTNYSNQTIYNCINSSINRTLRKHAYSNIPKILPPKNENFQTKKSDIFHISAQNIDYGCLLEPPRRGGSNEYPQSMLLDRNKKHNVYPCKPQFYNINVEFKGDKIL